MKSNDKLIKAHESVSLDAAALNWRCAQARFDYVDDEKLVDMAIFDMEAAKRRYMFLLKEAERTEN